MRYGDIRDELDVDPIVCTRCGARLELDLHLWGLDWPQKLEDSGWLFFSPNVALCLDCHGEPT